MRKVVWTILTLVLVPALALAQTTVGSIYGIVKTPEGLVVEGVKVTLSAGHIAEQMMMTSERGTFRFGELPIGSYKLVFEKEGYQKIVNEEVNVNLATATRLEILMKPAAVEAVIIITGQSEVIDMKKSGTATNLVREVLENIPSARDPWSVLDQVAGIQTDRVNVGGSESGQGQQSSLVSHGSSQWSSMWNYDGVTITDTVESGNSPTQFDFDSFEEMQVITGGADASIQTSGTSINLITKQGSDTLHGQGSIYYTSESFQDSNVPKELEEIGYIGNQVDSIKDYGFDLGGPIWKGNIWLWGAFRAKDHSLQEISGAILTTKARNYNLKFTGQAGHRNRWTFFYTRGEINRDGVGAGPYNPPETTIDDNTPTSLYKIEDTFLASDSLILSGKFSYVDNRVDSVPKGSDPMGYDLVTGMSKGSNYYSLNYRPQYQLQLTGENYLEKALGGSHELKAGFEWRHNPTVRKRGAPGNIEKWYLAGEPYFVDIESPINLEAVTKRISFFISDIYSLDRLTFILGVRYDRQWGNNRASKSPAAPVLQDLIPELDFPGQKSMFTWNDLVPRLGMTYDIFGDGKTILRSNFSMYAEQMGLASIMGPNPADWRILEYAWTDLNGDDYPQREELGDLWWASFNPYSSDPLDNGKKIDPGMKAPLTYEFIAGVERELIPDMSVAANFIYRKATRFGWSPEDGLSSADFYLAGETSGHGYTVQYYDTDKPLVFTTTAENRPDYHRVYRAIEISATKRLSNHWMANVSFNYNSNKQYWNSPDSYIDPTETVNRNGLEYSPYSMGKWGLRIGSRWMFKATALYQFPWDITVSGFLQAREGYVFPIMLSVPFRNYGGYTDLYGAPFGSERTPNITVADLRAEKVISFGDVGRLGLIIDVFNLFNSNTVLQKNGGPWGVLGETQEIINPRIVRLGARFTF